MSAPLINRHLELTRLHQELGIPPDYAASRGLSPVAEVDAAQLRIITTHPKEVRLIALAARAWSEMQPSAAAAGVELNPVSGFRSVNYQAELIRAKLRRGITIGEILAVNMAPGFSEHHSARALDVCTPGDPPLRESFARTAAFAWLSEHAGQFGFSLSYPQNNASGIQYEPWHWLWRTAE